MAVKNRFNLKTIHKLTRKQKSKQNKITVLSEIETNESNKWITLTYTGNESTIARTIRKIDKNIKIVYKTNNKLNNKISNKIEQYNNMTAKGFIK